MAQQNENKAFMDERETRAAMSVVSLFGKGTPRSSAPRTMTSPQAR